MLVFFKFILVEMKMQLALHPILSCCNQKEGEWG